MQIYNNRHIRDNLNYIVNESVKRRGSLYYYYRKWGPLINIQYVSCTSIVLLNWLTIDQHILLGTYEFSRNMHIYSAHVIVRMYTLIPTRMNIRTLLRMYFYTFTIFIYILPQKLKEKSGKQNKYPYFTISVKVFVCQEDRV